MKSGTTSVVGIYYKLGKLNIIKPPLDEQKRIVAKLDQCFEAIDKALINLEKNLINIVEFHSSSVKSLVDNLKSTVSGYQFLRLLI